MLLIKKRKNNNNNDKGYDNNKKRITRSDSKNSKNIKQIQNKFWLISSNL